jgi:hypothetical protein
MKKHLFPSKLLMVFALLNGSLFAAAAPIRAAVTPDASVLAHILAVPAILRDDRAKACSGPHDTDQLREASDCLFQDWQASPQRLKLQAQVQDPELFARLDAEIGTMSEVWAWGMFYTWSSSTADRVLRFTAGRDQAVLPGKAASGIAALERILNTQGFAGTALWKAWLDAICENKDSPIHEYYPALLACPKRWISPEVTSVIVPPGFKCQAKANWQCD